MLLQKWISGRQKGFFIGGLSQYRTAFGKHTGLTSANHAVRFKQIDRYKEGDYNFFQCSIQCMLLEILTLSDLQRNNIND